MNDVMEILNGEIHNKRDVMDEKVAIYRAEWLGKKMIGQVEKTIEITMAFESVQMFFEEYEITKNKNILINAACQIRDKLKRLDSLLNCKVELRSLAILVNTLEKKYRAELIVKESEKYRKDAILNGRKGKKMINNGCKFANEYFNENPKAIEEFIGRLKTSDMIVRFSDENSIDIFNKMVIRYPKSS